MDPLVLIEEEDGERGGVDEFLDLVFAEMAEESGFLVQSVGFVDDESAKGIGGCLRERPRTDEQIGDAGFLEGLRELALVDGARSAVLGHILGDKTAVGQFDKEVDGDHRLSSAWATVDDEDVLVRRG